MPDAIDELKDSLKSHLRLQGAELGSLDTAYEAISRGLPPLLTGLIVIAFIWAFTSGQGFLATILGIGAFWDFVVKSEFDKERLRVLADIASKQVCSTYMSVLNNRIGAISLSSLRETSWYSRFSIVFPSLGGESFGYFSDASLSPTKAYGKSFDGSRQAIELSPGLFVQYHDVSISLRCDFRVIRSEMTSNEVAIIFRSVADALPTIPIEGISLRQYSSTKDFLFTQDYVDSGTIAYIKTRSSQRNLQISKNQRSKLTSTPVLQTKVEKLETTNGKTGTTSGTIVKLSRANRSSANRQVSSAVSRLNNSLLLLNDILEKRKDVELRAMQIVMQYEAWLAQKTEFELGTINFFKSLFNDDQFLGCAWQKDAFSLCLTESESAAQRSQSRQEDAHCDSAVRTIEVTGSLSEQKTLQVSKQAPLPAHTSMQKGDESDPELLRKIEIKAMNLVLEHEKQQGRVPEDVSMYYVGYDIKSVDVANSVTRAIEVKGKVREGAIICSYSCFPIEHLSRVQGLPINYNSKLVQSFSSRNS